MRKSHVIETDVEKGRGHWVDKYITQQYHLAIVFTTSFPDSHESAHTSSADTTVVNTYTPAQSGHAKAAVTCNFLCILTMNCNDSKQADRETHMQREVATENIHFVPAVLYPCLLLFFFLKASHFNKLPFSLVCTLCIFRAPVGRL